MSRAGVLLASILGFALRFHALADVPLRWDEGWSIALAKLPAVEIMRLTALDVHPPLYYLSLAPWVAAGGSGEFWLRSLSALAGTLAVPLAAVAAASWWHASASAARRAALFAAVLVALAPAFLYYAGVGRMYALTASPLLLAVWGLARFASHGRPVHGVAAGVGAVTALLFFYYSGFAVAGLFAAAVVAWPRRWRRIGVVAAASALAYVPWLAYAAPLMASRVAERTGPGGFDLSAVAALADDGLIAALFLPEMRAAAVAVTLIVFVIGVAVARPPLWRHLGVAVLPLAATIVGLGLGAQAHMFQDRYAIVAAPFIALGLAWSVAGLWGRAPALGLVGLAALVLAAAPTIANYAYEREAELSGDYDPASVQRQLAEHTLPHDLVAFNVLSLAGAYERYRAPNDPPWTYGQVWDPVRESPELAVARVEDASRESPRLWLVLYKGTASPGSAALKAWADETLYPATGWWSDDTLLQEYVTAVPDREVAPHALFSGGARLVDASFTSRAEPGSGIAVALRWEADEPPTADARVFVHAYDPTGTLVAQHDAFPALDARPPTTWRAGEPIDDRHGLALPADVQGPLELVVGMYDPESGERWTLPGGQDGVVLGSVEVAERDQAPSTD
ncbi:MAG: hypothetical protein ACK2T6_01015 [Anaerolineae bacterium]